MFNDESPKAYGAVAYLVDEESELVILTFHARVASLKSKTLLQLVLMAVVAVVKLALYTKSTLIKICLLSVHLWVDSKITVQWFISNKSDITFVHSSVAQENKTQKRMLRKPQYITCRLRTTLQIVCMWTFSTQTNTQ